MGQMDDVYVEDDGTRVLKFGFTYSEKASGWVIRAFHPGTKHFEFRDSYFDDDLPRWIVNKGTSLVKGKGTPTIAFMDMFAMKRLGVQYGELRTAIICSVHDFESVLQLEWLQHKLSGKPLSELITHTRIYASRETPIIQSGHKIISAEVKGGRREKIDKILSLKEKYKFRDLFNKYGIARTDDILWKFDINFQLEPHK